MSLQRQQCMLHLRPSWSTFLQLQHPLLCSFHQFPLRALHQRVVQYMSALYMALCLMYKGVVAPDDVDVAVATVQTKRTI